MSHSASPPRRLPASPTESPLAERPTAKGPGSLPGPFAVPGLASRREDALQHLLGDDRPVGVHGDVAAVGAQHGAVGLLVVAGGGHDGCGRFEVVAQQWVEPERPHAVIAGRQVDDELPEVAVAYREWLGQQK